MRSARRRALLALAIIVSGGVGLRMYGLYGRSMWFDEGFSWRTIQFPVSEMIERTGRDNHPPLYYILLKLWTAAFGESLVALRSMNLVVSAVAMAGIYLWAVEAFARSGDRARARWIGLVSAVLFAVSTYQIRAAWEIRMYAMGTALVALSTWLLLRALCARAAVGSVGGLRRGRAGIRLHALLRALFPRGPGGVRGWILAGRVVQQEREIYRAGQAGRLHHNRWAGQAGRLHHKGGLAVRGCGVCRGRDRVGAVAADVLRQKEQVASDFWSVPFSLRDVYRVCYEMFFSTELARRANEELDEILGVMEPCQGFLAAKERRPNHLREIGGVLPPAQPAVHGAAESRAGLCFRIAERVPTRPLRTLRRRVSSGA